MVCKGICIRHKALKPRNPVIGLYSTGQKRCQICETFLKWDGLTCPCCGYKLRTGPRNLKYKAKLRARKKIHEYRLSLQQQHTVLLHILVYLPRYQRVVGTNKYTLVNTP